MSMKTEAAEQLDDKTMSQYHKAIQSHFIAQWITSLAISVVCCAVLFVVFAGYIVKLHEKNNIAEVRIEVLAERQSQLQSEVNMLRRAPLVQINSPGAAQITPPAEAAAPGQVVPEAAAPQPIPSAPAPQSSVNDDAGISLPPSENAAVGQEPAAMPEKQPDGPVDLPIANPTKKVLPLTR